MRVSSLIVVWLLYAILGTGCNALGISAPVDGSEIPDTDKVQDYAGTWQYRYGDSPRLADGTLLYTRPDATSADAAQWSITTQTRGPEGRGTAQYLFLRTRLVGPKLHHPTLLLSWAEQSFEAYVDGKLIAKHGDVEGPLSRRFPGYRSHALPLGEDYVGRLLVLRIYSPYARLGIPSPQKLGDYLGVLSAEVRDSLSVVLVSLLLVILGLVLLVLFFVQRTEVVHLLYSLCCLTLGVWVLCRSPIHSYFHVDTPYLYHLELASLALLGMVFPELAARILGHGRLGVFRWLSRAFVVYFVAATALVISGHMHVTSASEGLKALVLLTMATLVVVSLLGALRGDVYARMLSAGFLVTGVIGSWQLFQELRWLPRTGFVAHYAAVVFVLTWGLILVQRYRLFQRRLADYSSVLQLSFASARELSEEQHVQLVLAELVRMLQAERTLLFIYDPETDALELYAARGRTVNLDQTSATPTNRSYDARLIYEAKRTRRAIGRAQARPRTQTENGNDAARAVLASPLLARGQLYGVLYLEADASRARFDGEAVALLQGLSNQIALVLTTRKAAALERESAQAQQQLEAQSLLLAAVARLAQGDLETPITVPATSSLLLLATRLDLMRTDLRKKVDSLAESRRAIQHLNTELRQKLETRIQHLLDQALSEDGTNAILDFAKQRGNPKTLSPGELLANNYRVLALLGQGASGFVYEVERTTDKRRLAAKVILARAQKSAILQFAREAQILARLRDPNVIAIVDVDITADGSLFLVMELLPGTPLSHCQERYREVKKALPVLAQIASGLRSVHAHAVVHRDLKPANVLIAETNGEPQAKLLDFGVSTHLPSEALSKATEAAEPKGRLLGSPLYLAPELVSGSRDARPPADVFSFGVLAYELLSGVLPFEKPPVVSRYRGEPLRFVPVCDRCTNVPMYLSNLVTRCLAEDPSQRPTAEELCSLLIEVRAP